MTDAAANRIGRVFYGLAVLGTGLQQLAIAEFVRIVPRLPHWIPAQPLLARLGGVVLVAIGLALLTGKLARLAASVLAVLLLAILIVLYLPAIPTNPLAGFMYTNPLKVLSLIGGLMLLVPLLPEGPYSGGAKLLEQKKAAAPLLLAAFLVVCGIQHFWYLDFVQTLIPEYIPAPRLWAQFAGVCLLAGGIGLLVPKVSRLAALLTGLMVFLWVPMLHIPRALADLSIPGETSAIFEALALSGVALLVAGSGLRRPASLQR